MAEEVDDEGKSRSRKRQRVRATQLFKSNGIEGEGDEDETRDIPNNGDEEDDENDFDDICSNLFDGASENLSSSESCLRYYVIDPLLKACNEYLKDLGYNVTFYPGGTELKAMAVQLKDQDIIDKRLRYNTDGKILCNSIAAEVLLSEVPSAFAKNDKGKTRFDHYKAIFGFLMMLRTLARKYKYASFNSFKNSKFYFIHTYNHIIRHWNFERKSECVIPFMNFTISLGVSLVETMNALSVLSKGYDKVLKKTYFGIDEGGTYDNTHVSLLEFVSPVLVRLNENKHKYKVAEEGPQSPSSYF
ncbi:hypothetical protein CU098_011385 [Rhizopus stolonifer]|uniref:Uncharacterized protein n=1 Tax=Rhizopus stolonifer TaxID=4846 RepID=A0A367KM86_RHIST|nr:hypothetical protein CU098_011385 [Rhizopus stolonifer]